MTFIFKLEAGFVSNDFEICFNKSCLSVLFSFY